MHKLNRNILLFSHIYQELYHHFSAQYKTNAGYRENADTNSAIVE